MTSIDPIAAKLPALAQLVLTSIALTPATSDAQVVSNSLFEIVANVSDVRLVSKPGTTKSTKVLFWSSKKVDPPQQARAQIAVIEILPGATVNGTTIRLQANVKGIDCEGCDFIGAKVIIGSK